MLGVFTVYTATREVRIAMLQFEMYKTSRKNVFRGKQTTKEVLSNMFRPFEDGKIVRLLFSSPNHNIKEKWNVLGGEIRRTTCASYI